MPFKDLWPVKASVETVAISGALRVKIDSHAPPLAIFAEITGLVSVTWAVRGPWHRMDLLDQVVVATTLLSGAAGLAYLATNSELIEFDQQNLTIGRSILGWEHFSRYPIESCTELSWCVQGENSKFALECKYGWRKLKFARNASEEQARDILAMLQNNLPEVAQKMGMTPGGRHEHITRLGLS
jgi:hypothetical protein